MHNKNKYPGNDCSSHEGCRSGKRNRYFKGKNMIADDFTLEQRYGIERRLLLNRAIHGWGVAYGFKLEIIEGGKLKCGKGLALDSYGRELYRTEDGEVPVHLIKLLNASDRKTQEGDGPFRYLLQAHYAERTIDSVRLGDSCGCGDREWNHLCETVVFSLRPLCREHECPSFESPCLKCHCRTDNEAEIKINEGTERLINNDRGPHHCLCSWLTKKNIPADPEDLCMWEGFKGLCIAVNDSVPLACVTISFDDCGHPSFACIDDACTPRRLVKTNDLLFDLIRGCDLTRIIEISWAEWHRQLTRDKAMHWNTFQKMIAPHQTASEQEERMPSAKTNFWIRFSAPVEIDTLRPDCVVMTVFAAEDEGGWVEVRRVPITGLAPHIDGDCPDGFTDQVNICVDSGWCDDEILGHKSIFHRSRIRVEIEVRGDLILDCQGQAIDANAVGVRPVPTGNGTPGGTYISAFRVAPKRETKAAIESED
jgi:hypothetical protein